MNLLDSVLYTSNASEYVTNFRQHGIDAHTLRLLDDDDLKTLGIKEEEKRESILQHAANLQISSEKQISVNIDHKFIELALAQVSFQITKHLAALSIAVNRPDTVICNVRLDPATTCLKHCVRSLKENLDELEKKVISKPKETKRPKYLIIPLAAVVSIGIVSYELYIYCLRR